MSGLERTSRNGRRVAPEDAARQDIEEIRPKRFLRIRKLNFRKRDEKFEKEMQAYLQYRESGTMCGLAMMSGLPSARKSSGQPTPRSNNSTDQPNGNTSSNNPQVSPADAADNNRATKDSHKKLILDTEKASSEKDTNEHMDSDTEKKFISPSNLSRGTIHSPSSNSVHSLGVQSASGIQMVVNNRPSSEIQPLNSIEENKNKEEDDDNMHSKTPRKTKGHRPVSARSFKQSSRSLTVSEIEDTKVNMPALESFSCSHLDSSFRDVTLFFIHGVGGSSDIWTAQIDFFSGLGLEIIAPDLLGHGFSGCPDNRRDYHFKEILADMEAVFDKYCKKQNVVIGHSYGCAFAAALSRLRSRRVSKLVMMSGGAPIPLAPQVGVFSLPVCALSCIRPCLFNRFERGAFHNTKDSGLSREVAFDVPIYVLSHMMSGQDWLDGDELYHQWISAPTLLLHGKYDRFVSLEEEQEMEAAIYYSRLEVVDQTSHMVMMEAPNQVNKLLYEFIFEEVASETERSAIAETKSLHLSARSRAKQKTSKSLA